MRCTYLSAVATLHWAVRLPMPNVRVFFKETMAFVCCCSTFDSVRLAITPYLFNAAHINVEGTKQLHQQLSPSHLQPCSDLELTILLSISMAPGGLLLLLEEPRVPFDISGADIRAMVVVRTSCLC